MKIFDCCKLKLLDFVLFQCNSPSNDATFIQDNPLLDDLVENYNPAEPVKDKSDSPMFYTDEGGRFSVIAVDDNGANNIDNNIYYIGTGEWGEDACFHNDKCTLHITSGITKSCNTRDKNMKWRLYFLKLTLFKAENMLETVYGVPGTHTPSTLP